MRSPNYVLAVMSADDHALIAADLESVELTHKMDLERPHEPIDYVYFPEGGIASVVVVAGEENLETSVLGREGMTGSSVVHGADQSPFHTFIQVPGRGQRVAIGPFRAALDASRTLHATCLCAAEANHIQTAHTALANGRCSIEERLARWLLMCLDRQDGDELELTHEFLALMLGVRRAGVTTALHVLEGGHMIKSTRGLIVVKDRERLRQTSGDAYGEPEREYHRLMGRELSRGPVRQ